MPKKNEKIASRLTYDVSRVSPSNLKPLALTRLERSDVIKSFQPHNPSDKFFNDYERAVQIFVWDVEEVQKVTPSKVSARIKDGIHKNAQQLLSDLLSLEITDQALLDCHFTTQPLARFTAKGAVVNWRRKRSGHTWSGAISRWRGHRLLRTVRLSLR